MQEKLYSTKEIRGKFTWKSPASVIVVKGDSREYIVNYIPIYFDVSKIKSYRNYIRPGFVIVKTDGEVIKFEPEENPDTLYLVYYMNKYLAKEKKFKFASINITRYVDDDISVNYSEYTILDLKEKYEELNDMFIEHTGNSFIAFSKSNMATTLFVSEPNLHNGKLYRLKTVEDAQYIGHAIDNSGPVHERYRKDGLSYVYESKNRGLTDYLVEVDINSFIPYNMAANEYPFGGYKKWIWEDIDDDKKDKLMNRIYNRDMMGFIEISDVDYPEKPLKFFNIGKVITTEQFIDGADAGYVFKIESIMLFEKHDYIFTDAIVAMYKIKIDRRCNDELKWSIKADLNKLYGIFLKKSMLRGYRNQDSGIYIAAFINYYCRKNLRQVIESTCKSHPLYIKTDSFIIHVDDFTGEISDKLGGLKYVNGRITKLTNDAKSTTYTYIDEEGYIRDVKK